MSASLSLFSPLPFSLSLFLRGKPPQVDMYFKFSNGVVKERNPTGPFKSSVSIILIGKAGDITLVAGQDP